MHKNPAINGSWDKYIITWAIPNFNLDAEYAEY